MYVVFDIDSTMEVETYHRYHDAKRYCDRLNEGEKRRWAHQPKYARRYDVYHIEFYNQYIVHWERVKNLMSNTPVWQKSNTPICCDVFKETYWSM